MTVTSQNESGPVRSDARVTAVCVFHSYHVEPTNPDGLTAIDKRPIEGRVEIGRLGVAGDSQCDIRHHGGQEQAVYAYADEDAAWWAGELGRDVTPGLFGENLRTSAIDVTGAEIGERWRVGGPDGVLLQVTSPRVPCATFQRRLGEPHWVKRFTERGTPGAYLAVLQTGGIAAGDEVAVEFRPGHGVTVADAFLRPEPATMQRLLDADRAGVVELTPKMREHALRAVARS